MGRPLILSDAEIERYAEQLRETGSIYSSARNLQIAEANLRRRLKHHPALRHALEEGRILLKYRTERGELDKREKEELAKLERYRTTERDAEELPKKVDQMRRDLARDNAGLDVIGMKEREKEIAQVQREARAARAARAVVTRRENAKGTA